MATSASTPSKIKGTSITTPTATGDNHTLVLGQLKETAEIAQRLRGDPNDSFVRVGEINSALGTRMVNGTLQPPNSSTASGASVAAINSIMGNGTALSPLQLVGDSASPGNSMVYGTNGSGVKGWYAAGGGGGGSLTVTDGTNSVTGTTSLTVVGGVVSGSTPNATVTVSGSVIDLAHGGGNVATPSNSGWTLNLNGGVGTATFGANGQLILNVTTLVNNATYRKTYGGGNFDIQWYVTNTPDAANFPANFSAAYGFFIRDIGTGNMISCGSPSASMSAVNLLNLTSAAGATIGAVALSSNVGAFGNGGATFTLNVQYGWGRLTRVGNVYTFYVSIDGAKWLSLGTQTSNFAATPTQFGIYMFTTGLITFWSLSGI